MIECGLYQIYLEHQRDVVQIIDMLMDQYPSQRVCRMAVFLSGPPRFPIPLKTLISYGCNFQVIKA